MTKHIQHFFLQRLKIEVFGDDGATSKLSKKDEIVIWLWLRVWQVQPLNNRWSNVLSLMELLIYISFLQRQLYEAFLNREIVLSAFDGSPLAAQMVTWSFLPIFLFVWSSMCLHVFFYLVNSLNKCRLSFRSLYTLLSSLFRIYVTWDSGFLSSLIRMISFLVSNFNFITNYASTFLYCFA